jgi:hypothetical protein
MMPGPIFPNFQNSSYKITVNRQANLQKETIFHRITDAFLHEPPATINFPLHICCMFVFRPKCNSCNKHFLGCLLFSLNLYGPKGPQRMFVLRSVAAFCCCACGSSSNFRKIRAFLKHPACGSVGRGRWLGHEVFYIMMYGHSRGGSVE